MEPFAMNRSNVQPGVRYYGLAVLIIVLGFAAFALSIYSGMTDAEGGLLRMTAPGSADLFLAEPGEYIIFYGKLYWN
jgi:hypothetical protein